MIRPHVRRSAPVGASRSGPASLFKRSGGPEPGPFEFRIDQVRLR